MPLTQQHLRDCFTCVRNDKHYVSLREAKYERRSNPMNILNLTAFLRSMYMQMHDNCKSYNH